MVWFDHGEIDPGSTIATAPPSSPAASVATRSTPRPRARRRSSRDGRASGRRSPTRVGPVLRSNRQRRTWKSPSHRPTRLGQFSGQGAQTGRSSPASEHRTAAQPAIGQEVVGTDAPQRRRVGGIDGGFTGGCERRWVSAAANVKLSPAGRDPGARTPAERQALLTYLAGDDGNRAGQRSWSWKPVPRLARADQPDRDLVGRARARGSAAGRGRARRGAPTRPEGRRGRGPAPEFRLGERAPITTRSDRPVAGCVEERDAIRKVEGPVDAPEPGRAGCVIASGTIPRSSLRRLFSRVYPRRGAGAWTMLARWGSSPSCSAARR